jgi:hypothetical protein
MEFTFWDAEELLKWLGKALSSQQRTDEKGKEACHLCGC